jgi:tRNA 2-thiocytidine biosynthesis protein TtcA
MPARLRSDDGRHLVIRPLVYVTEAECRAYAGEYDLPIVACCCPSCGDLSLQRQRIKRLLMELEREHPSIKSSMITALANVVPSHLLDRRLHPIAEAAAEASQRSSADHAHLLPVLTARPSGVIVSDAAN